MTLPPRGRYRSTPNPPAKLGVTAPAKPFKPRLVKYFPNDVRPGTLLGDGIDRFVVLERYNQASEPWVWVLNPKTGANARFRLHDAGELHIAKHEDVTPYLAMVGR